MNTNVAVTIDTTSIDVSISTGTYEVTAIGNTGLKGDTGATGSPGITVAATAPADTSILWGDTTVTPNYTPVPAGGSTGQSLVKVSGSDYAVGWAAPTIAPAQVTGTAVVDADARLTDTRTPTDGSVTNAKVAAGAAIDVSKLSGVVPISTLAASLDLQPNTAETTQRRNSSVLQSITNSTVWFTHFSSLYTFSATSVTVYCTTAHTATAPSVCRVGLYSFDETNGYSLLNASTHSTNVLSATGFRTFSIPTTTVTAGSRYAIGLIVVGASPTVVIYGRTDAAGFNAGANTGVSPVVSRISWSQTGQSDLPASLAYATGTVTASTQWSRIS